MLQVSGINKRYGDHIVLKDVSFTINEDDRLGLIGPNGCGKTTLLRIIAGRERAEGGSVHPTRPHLRLGTLEQGLAYREDDTLATLLGVGEEQLARAEAEVARLAEAVAEAGLDEQPPLLAAYGRALETLEAAAAKVSATHTAEAILAGLGLSHLPLETPVAILSGGQKTRLGLAKLLLEDPHLLLLDEPTNHLDIEALQWLEEWLASYPGAALIVSHDRTLLDRTVDTILDLDPETHTVTAYPGNYGDYIEAKTRERETQWAAYREQQERIARVRGEVSRLGNYAGSIERGTIDFAIRKIAKGIARRAVVQKRRLERELAQERLEKPGQSWQLKLDFGDLPATGQDVLILEELSAGYGGVPLFAGINRVLRAGERVALVGPNGSGKTTLLRVMSGELAPLAGRVRLGANVRLGTYTQEQEDLDPDSTPFETIRRIAAMSETEIRSFLHFFLFSGDDVLVANRDLSYGERARLALAQLVASGCNCLLLDEPINHLDIPSRAKFEQAMTAFDGTVLAVVHDRYFIRRFATQVWSLDGGTLRRRYDLEGSEL